MLSAAGCVQSSSTGCGTPGTPGSTGRKSPATATSCNSGLSQLWDKEHNQHVVGRLLELIEPEITPVTWQAFRRQVTGGFGAGLAWGTAVLRW
jgi:hypothetical protein